MRRADSKQLHLPVHAEERQPRPDLVPGGQAGRRDEAAEGDFLDTDQQDDGVQTMVQVDGNSARRLGLTASGIDAALYDAFGQRQVTICTDSTVSRRQWAPDYTHTPLSDVYVPATKTVLSNGQAVAIESTAATSAIAQRGACGVRDPALKNASSGNVLSNSDRRWRQRREDLRRLGADLGQPPGRRLRRRDLVQPRRQRGARSPARPTSACPSTCAARRHGADARQKSRGSRRSASSTSSSASSTKA